uniref:dUTP diphosphatase n=1 Tax=Eubacterium plexicaudatum ASF492 TaxID=1235802 RepID=N2AN46_9FIRM
MEQQVLKIKYHSKEIEKLTYIAGKSDWIDLRSAQNVTLKKGEFRLISLGISIQLPKGYEAVIVPRSSTFKNFGIIQTNHMGVIDESYCGDEDLWMMPVLAVRDTQVRVNDRICQFRIQKHQPHILFEETDSLHNPNRGGFGSTGKQ